MTITLLCKKKLSDKSNRLIGATYFFRNYDIYIKDSKSGNKCFICFSISFSHGNQFNHIIFKTMPEPLNKDPVPESTSTKIHKNLSEL